VPPYPSAKVFLTQFGIVSVYAYRQGLSPLSWLSYSPSAFSAERRACHARLPASPLASSPRRPRLCELVRPHPLEGLVRRSERHPFENHGCPRGQSVPVAQTPDNLIERENLWGERTYGIETAD
jgi:hypothetical protein